MTGMLEYGDGLWSSIGLYHSQTRSISALPFVFVSVSCLLVFCDFMIGLNYYYYYYLLVLSVCIVFFFTHRLNVDCFII